METKKTAPARKNQDGSDFQKYVSGRRQSLPAALSIILNSPAFLRLA
jgi:hypothetical protein